MTHLSLISGVILLLIAQSIALNSVWSWDCQYGHCVKKLITADNEESAQSQSVCRLYCSNPLNYAALWPQPTGMVQIGEQLLKINKLTLEGTATDVASPIHNLLLKAFDNLTKKTFRGLRPTSGSTLELTISVKDTNWDRLSLETDESYSLEVVNNKAAIKSETFFGARHALETLGQLIVFDDLRDEFLIPSAILVTDKPKYPYRGILLDTSRNFVDVATIKRTIKGMAASKLNSFHWHITDSQSFPFVSKSRPDLSTYGAYSSKQVYNAEDVAEVVEFGRQNGVRVVPEFDAPAHVGEGWQMTDMVVCFNKKPWKNYCAEPPCGQLDPTNEEVYNMLEDIYMDMVEAFEPELFHMGGDEVNFNCWNTTDSIVDWMEKSSLGRAEGDFVQLWLSFQEQALERLQRHKQVPTILWTSTLTEGQYLQSLPKDQYIIQIWTGSSSPQVRILLEKGYRVIFSNVNALYLDCGFAAWAGRGNNWCSPYKGWQVMYENSLSKIAQGRNVSEGQILGAEATLWSESADGRSVDGRVWPRASAMAESLWSEPQGVKWEDAFERFLVHRERLVDLGIGSDAIAPEWCLQNEGDCI